MTSPNDGDKGDGLGLAITRREQEGVSIGEDVYVQVVSVRPGEVTLNIIAPRDIKILRDDKNFKTSICLKNGKLTKRQAS